MHCLPQAILLFAVLGADGPNDNKPDHVRPIPPLGIAVPDNLRGILQSGTDQLGKEIESLRTDLRGKPKLLELLPDVLIYHKAVLWALKYNEFYNPKEFTTAANLLTRGLQRAKALRAGRAPWTTQTGLVVRGYVSRIDGSVQPYGLVVPASYRPNTPHLFRLDVWWHGRGETLTELAFIDQRQRSPGEFTPANTFVLHPYGRYCNANRFAGEVDTFEAMANVKKHYPIDENRVVARGFSMGGAACWTFATHHPDVWCAAAPGAGFSETAEFLRVFQNEMLRPTDYEQQLWHWYDSTDYAVNLFNLPTVAYSGEIDRQKQAADAMATALKKEGIALTHIIGPKTAHRYEPRAKHEVAERIDRIAAHGRPALPHEVRFTTFTLRYNRSYFIELDSLEHHWQRARAQAVLSKHGFQVKTENVTALTLRLRPGQLQEGVSGEMVVKLDGQSIALGLPNSDRSLVAHFRRTDGHWQRVERAGLEGLVKRHGLQGPIDEAFCDRFLMVRPTAEPMHEKTGAWVKAELAHALDHWRSQFRGDAPVKDDTAVTDADIASSNLILWGDPHSNKLLARIADKLPIRWEGNEVVVGSRRFPADHHVPALIFPNPLNPKRYVVLNSGFTFREYAYLNNARQVPMLPDYAVIDVSRPVTTQSPGGIAAAGFFTERWALPAATH